jgi:hypothetical protein
VISFDGVDDRLRNATQMVGGTTFTIFSVMSVLNRSYPSSLGEPGHRTTYEGFPRGGVPSTNSFDLSRDSSNDARATLPGIGDSTAKVLSVTSTGTTAGIQVFANGVAATMTTTGSVGPTDISAGNTLGSAFPENLFTRVNVSEFIVYSEVLSVADRLAVEEYLREKYNLGVR